MVGYIISGAVSRTRGTEVVAVAVGRVLHPKGLRSSSRCPDILPRPGVLCRSWARCPSRLLRGGNPAQTISPHPPAVPEFESLLPLKCCQLPGSARALGSNRWSGLVVRNRRPCLFKTDFFFFLDAASVGEHFRKNSHCRRYRPAGDEESPTTASISDAPRQQPRLHTFVVASWPLTDRGPARRQRFDW